MILPTTADCCQDICDAGVAERGATAEELLGPDPSQVALTGLPQHKDTTAEELLGLEASPPQNEGQGVVVAAPDHDTTTVQGETSSLSEQAPSSSTQPSAMTSPTAWQGLEPFMDSIGLAKYTEVLKQQELTDPESLAHVTDDDLKELNVTIGARRKLLAAIRRLQSPGA